jgi:hypothetical protein
LADKYYIGTDGSYSTAGNWSPSGVPVNSDVVYIDNNATSITTGLNQSAVTLTALNIGMGFTGSIGTSSAYLQIGATTCNIGLPGASNVAGSALIKLDFGSVQTTVNVLNSATSGTSGKEPILLIGTNASNVINVSKGTVGIARNTQIEVATFASVNVGTVTEGSSGVVNIGAGSTITSIRIGSGKVTNFGASMSGTGKQVVITDSAGKYIAYGSAAHTSVDIRAGTVVYNSSGTITTLAVKGSIDFSADPRTKTVTNCSLYKGGKILADNGYPLGVTFTNGIDYYCALSEAVVDMGETFTVSFSAI